MAVQMAEIFRGLEATTGPRVPIEVIGRVSPLANAHVIPSGTYRYHFRAATAPGSTPARVALP